MGYRIVYDGREGKYEVKSCHPHRFWLLLTTVLLVILTFWQNGVEYIREALIPGDNQATLSAVQNLTEGLGQGMGLKDAVTAFCMEIIHGSAPAN